MIEANCIFCGVVVLDFQICTSSSEEYRCQNCGNYKATSSFRASAQRRKLDGGRNVIVMGDETFPLEEVQGAIYESNLCTGAAPHFFTTENAEGLTLRQLLVNVSVPSNPSEKIDRLLQNLDRSSKSTVGASMKIEHEFGGKWCYTHDHNEFRLIMHGAKDRGYFAEFRESTGGYSIVLSLSAWERISKLKEQTTTSRQGFVACWFSTPPNPSNAAIIAGIEAAEFKPMSLEGKHYPETIISKALGEIKKSRFVVVDLTEERRSVFFEAGYALGRGLQVIFVVQKDYWIAHKVDLEFYVKNYNIKQYENPDQLKEIVESAIRERIG